MGETTAAELGDVGQAFGSITEPERAAVTFWRGFVASVPDAAPPALLAILQDYAETWKATRSSVTVAVAVDAYEAAKTAEGLRPQSLQAIRTRCRRFVKDFGSRSISSITTAEISDWILSLPVLIQRGPVKAKPGKGFWPYGFLRLKSAVRRIFPHSSATRRKSRFNPTL